MIAHYSLNVSKFVDDLTSFVILLGGWHGKIFEFKKK